jgi:transposase
MARGDLTDDEWSLIEPHFPLGERGPIPDLRQQFNAVMWRFRTGSPWRDLPAEYGPWSTVYDRFRSWATTGVFEQLMQTVIAEAAARGQVDLDLVSVDSTTARAHHHAAGMVVDGELMTALEKAAEEERGLHLRGKSPRTAGPATATATATAGSVPDADGCDCGAGSG